jgi:hypothetical protein
VRLGAFKPPIVRIVEHLAVRYTIEHPAEGVKSKVVSNRMRSLGLSGLMVRVVRARFPSSS